MYTYSGGLSGPPGVPHYMGPSGGGPTYLPSQEVPPQHHQMLTGPLMPNVIPVGPQSCSSSNSGTVGVSLSPQSKRKR